ncbi:MAG: SLC13 family permease [Vicinamibacterales bacterium]
MNLAWLSLAALLVAIVLSCVTQLNVGILGLAFAWVLGVYIAGMPLNDVLAGFPVQLFLMLVGVTLLFAQAQVNGTLDKLSSHAVRLCGGNLGFVPVMFFLVASVIASLGPGHISTAAMLAPMAMPMASRAGIPLFLMAIMVGNGAQAGSLSPFAPTGVIVSGIMTRINMGGHEWYWFGTAYAAHAIIAFGGYFLFGGWRLFGRTYHDAATGIMPFDRRNWLTLLAIVGVIASVLLINANVGMAAFFAAAALAVLGAADHEQSVKKMPWTAIVMVTGVTVLISMLEKTGGLELFSAMLAAVATPSTMTGVVAFVTGVISVFSSTSGVVLPAFLPTIPSVIARLGGGDPFALAASMNIGSHLVDMSPLSTTGAVCLAGVHDPKDFKATYNKLLAWGASMTIVGAIGCYLFF